MEGNKTFGFWKEFGDNYKEYPSVYDYVDEVINNSYDKDKLCRYLENGTEGPATSALPSPFTGERREGSSFILSDENGSWVNDVIEYIKYNHLVLPEGWYEAIAAKNFNTQH